MAPKFDRELLERVADGMLDVMGLDPNPFGDRSMMDDDVLLDIICEEARGRGVETDAVRADDFMTADADKKIFAADVQKFFADAGIWDAKRKRVIAAAKPAVAAKAAEPELALGDEQAEHAEMEAGETTGDEPPVAPPVEPKKAGKKTARAVTVPAKPAAAVVDKKAGKAAPAAPAGQAPEDKEGTMKTSVRGAVSKRTATAKKRAARGTVAQKKTAVKDKKAPANLDTYGFREGSSTGKAIAFLAAGKHTMAEAKEKFGSTFYSSLKKIVAAGGKVVANDDSTFTITAKKK